MKSLRMALVILSCGILIVCAAIPARSEGAPTRPVNLALNKPATCSSVENASHPASMANDGDQKTRWCANDATVPQWWQVDLGSAATLTGCQIMWELDGKHMLYTVDGSSDGIKWSTISDQSHTADTKQTQTLTFDKPAGDIRYFRVTITGDEPRAWASICEVRVYGN